MPCQRLFNGHLQQLKELKHITIDRYDKLILLTTYHNTLFPQEFVESFFTSNDQHLVWRERNKNRTNWHFLKGEKIHEYLCEENGLTYKIKLGDSQNVGLFLDMSNARKYIKENSAHKSVLNLFSYSCSFSVAAIAGQAKFVTNVDMKSTFLNWGKDNHSLNKQQTSNVKFFKHNILKSLNGYIKRGPFDIIIIDPPTYQPGGFKLKQDYPKILKKIPAMLSLDGEALICSNDPLQSMEEFFELVSAILPKENLKTAPIDMVQNFDGPKIIRYHN